MIRQWKSLGSWDGQQNGLTLLFYAGFIVDEHADMNTLLNVDTRQGVKDASCVRPASDVSPKVQSPKVENSDTGVSSDYALIEGHVWFVLRATYGRTKQACNELKKKGIMTYIPMGYIMKEINGKKKRVKTPLLPNIIFAYTAREEIRKFVKKPALTAQYLKYYLDRTRDVEKRTELNPPVVVEENDMRNFIRVTSLDNEHVMIISPERCHYKSGDLVRVIQGQFKGVVGKVVRAAGQQRVAVNVEGVCTVVTAYIPSDFMIKLQNN